MSSNISKPDEMHHLSPPPDNILHGRSRVEFLFAIDFGFLLEGGPENAEARREIFAERAAGFISESVFDGKSNFTFAGLEKGRRETADIADRAIAATRAGGKDIWSKSLLADEAPVIFLEDPSDILVREFDYETTRRIKFGVSKEQIRFFPRGVLTISQAWTLEDQAPDFTVKHFIEVYKQARSEAEAAAWSRLRGILLALTDNDTIGDIAAGWRNTEPNDEAFVRQHLIRHSLLFFESLPGSPLHAEPNFDSLTVEQKRPIAGILNSTKWFDLYGQPYIERVFRQTIQNRQDELYLTGNDCSIVVLAGYWTNGDPLAHYRDDLVLATLFELSRLTHLRYLAYYLRADPQSFSALATTPDSDHDSLRFVLDAQRVVARSGHDHPAEVLIRHGFTRRFTQQIAQQRGTQGSLDELTNSIGRAARALELRTGLTLADNSVQLARKTYAVNLLVLILTIVVVVLTAVTVVVALD